MTHGHDGRGPALAIISVEEAKKELRLLREAEPWTHFEAYGDPSREKERATWIDKVDHAKTRLEMAEAHASCFWKDCLTGEPMVVVPLVKHRPARKEVEDLITEYLQRLNMLTREVPGTQGYKSVRQMVYWTRKVIKDHCQEEGRSMPDLPSVPDRKSVV